VRVYKLLERVPAVTNRLGIVHFSVTHLAHSKNVPLGAFLFERGNGNQRSIDNQELPDYIVIHDVKFKLVYKKSLLNR